MHRLGARERHLKGWSGLRQGNQWITASSSGSQRLLPTEWEGIRSCTFWMVKATLQYRSKSGHWLSDQSWRLALVIKPLTLHLPIYLYLCINIITTALRGGRPQNASYMFQGVFEGGLENVSLQVEGILKTLLPGGRSGTNFTFKGVPKNVSFILAWFPAEK